MKPTKATHLFSSPKIAQRIAARVGEKSQPITVRLMGKKDVNKLVSGIAQAEKSSLKKSIHLD